MRMRNNNQAIEKELAVQYYKTNRKKNEILILAIAMSVFLLYTVFSIVDGKIRSDYLIDVRGMGTLATVALQNGSEAQYHQMTELPYLSDVGVVKKVSEASGTNQWNGILVYMDTAAYEKLQKPAYTDISGAYPVAENEIMLPIRALEAMGISHPEIGMEIPLSIAIGGNEKTIYRFHLSGYYVDYIDASVHITEAYVSEEFLNKNNIPIFPADKIIAAHNKDEDSKRIEGRLYSDLTMESESQQVMGENPMVMQSIQEVFGSRQIAIGCMIMIALCAFMLIYNVISISMGKDIRQYGLLKVLGTTNSQLKRIAYRQNLWNIMLGASLGGIAGGIFIKIFLKGVLHNLFMKGLGESDVKGIYLDYLLFSVVIVSVTTFIATRLAVRRVMRWNAIDTIKYTAVDTVFYSKKKSNDISMKKIAWRNITRSKKRLIVSLCSLLLAEVLFLGSAVIVTGTSQTNRLEENPDFQAGILTGAFRYPDKIPGELNDNTEILSAEMIQQMIHLDGVEDNSIDYVKGSYAVIDFTMDQALEPRRKSLEDTEGGRKLATLQIVSDDYITLLEKYAKERDVPIDIESLKNGTGCALLHYGEMSQILDEQAKKVLGMPIHFYSLTAYHQEEADTSYERGILSCAGYLDCTDSLFPKLHTTSMGNNINYFIMTEAAFEKMEFTSKTFDISFDVNEGEEPILHQKMVQIIQNENMKSGIMDSFYEDANYLLLENEKNEVQTANFLLGGLSVVLLLVGIMNFSNTLMTNHTIRKKELSIMQSIGLTKKQLMKMILMEGCFYWVLMMLGTITIGSVSIVFLGFEIGQKLLYFKFFYPWKQLILLMVLLFIVNLVLSVKMYFVENND